MLQCAKQIHSVERWQPQSWLLQRTLSWYARVVHPVKRAPHLMITIQRYARSNIDVRKLQINAISCGRILPLLSKILQLGETSVGSYHQVFILLRHGTAMVRNHADIENY